VIDKKAAIREYKLSHRPMGVFQIRNKVSGKVLIDSSINIPGKINRHTLQLNVGSHQNKQLQADWKEFGPDALEFETLEPLEPRDDQNYDYAADLSVLEELWLEKAAPFGENGYNEKKLTREERLQMIAANRQNREQ
jgi:hypothetical protein